LAARVCEPYVAGQVSLNYGYQTLPLLRASALYYLVVVWAAVLGALFLGESVDAYGGSGAAIIALGEGDLLRELDPDEACHKLWSVCRPMSVRHPWIPYI